jgi:prepilin-type N-terminal cleavage/methylation domain-containing protein
MSRSPARQRGFTLVEVLVALVIFAISVVGLVALESRSIESHKSSAQIREAERTAQEAMAELASRSFLELVVWDFEGNPNPAFPYDDRNLDVEQRLRSFRSPPADTDVVAMGGIGGQFIVFRTVDWIFDPQMPPNNPPDPSEVNALVLDVTVMWIDDSNPGFPPPADARVQDLLPSMIIPGDPTFAPHVGHVQLRTVRVNDAVLSTIAPPDP